MEGGLAFEWYQKVVGALWDSASHPECACVGARDGNVKRDAVVSLREADIAFA